MTTAAPPKPEFEETFDERVDILYRELARSIRFNRPSILLAVYSSEYARADAENACAAKLRELGQSAVKYRVNEATADIPLMLSQQDDLATSVYFVTGLQWGGGRDERLRRVGRRWRVRMADEGETGAGCPACEPRLEDPGLWDGRAFRCRVAAAGLHEASARREGLLPVAVYTAAVSLDRLLAAERRQDPRPPSREHALARAGRPGDADDRGFTSVGR